MWNDDDFESDDPLVRHNAHQAAKGRDPLPDPDVLRDRGGMGIPRLNAYVRDRPTDYIALSYAEARAVMDRLDTLEMKLLRLTGAS